MAQDNKGSDLSDLKSRLGLSESEESDEDQSQGEGAPAQQQPGQGGPPEAGAGGGPQPGAGPSQGGPPQGGGPPAAGQNPSGPGNQAHRGAPGAPAPNQGGPQQGGPPGGAPPRNEPPGGGAHDAGEPAGFEEPSGPPGAGLERGSAAEEDFGGAPSEPMPDFGEDVDEGGVLGQGVLTNAVLGLLVIVLIVGILFGLFAMSSYQGRWLYNAQTDQAQRVLDELEPKVENFKGVAETVKGLDADVVEYDKAADLAEKEISLDMSVLGTDKLLLGGERINMLTAYMVQAERLETMLEEHNRKTNKADKEELEKIAGGEEEQKEEKEVQYAAVFSFDHLNQTGKDPQKYEPKPGQIVKVPKEAEPGDDGKIEVEVPSSGQAVKVDVRGIVPLSRGQLLSVGGENAFGRYRQRVNEIKHVVKKLSQSPEALIERMRQLAERGSAPIFEF